MKSLPLNIDCAAPSGLADFVCSTGGYAALAPVCVVAAPSGLITERHEF
jgi:hypothetical protein